MGTFAFFLFCMYLIINIVTNKVQHLLYVLYICYSIASVLVIVSAFQIYIKMNTGEDGIVKSFLSLLGACLFIIGASIVLPAFFGYRI